MSKQKDTRETKSQSQRAKFVKTARELGCEEDEKAFDAALKKVATTGASKISKSKPSTSKS
jgi:hypothetical protein